MRSLQYAPTVGVEFYLKRAVLPGPRNVSLKLWDVGGSALPPGGAGGGPLRMLDKYLYGADAVVLVYDVSNYDSFENLQEWLAACKTAVKNNKAGRGRDSLGCSVVKCYPYLISDFCGRVTHTHCIGVTLFLYPHSISGSI